MLRVQSFVVLFFCFAHDVLIGSFSDMIFYPEYMLFSCLWLCFTYLVLMSVMLSIWDIFHLYIMIIWVWPIMEDIEPFDLGSGDLGSLRLWPISPSDQSSIISISTPWLCGLDDLPILSLTWHHPLVPLHDFTTLVYLSILQYHCLFFPSFPWSGQVESEMVWPEVSFTRW